MIDVVPAKFDPPTWLGNQLQRNHLLELLDNALHRRLTLVSALQAMEKPVCCPNGEAELLPVGFSLCGFRSIKKMGISNAFQDVC
jgi:hypothetical protein